MSAIPTHLGLGPLPDKSYAVSFCLVLRLTVIRNKAGRRGDMAPRCQAPGLMESFLLGIHQLVHELGNPWQRTEIVCSERGGSRPTRSEEHTSELQSRFDLVCRLLLEKKNTQNM